MRCRSTAVSLCAALAWCTLAAAQRADERNESITRDIQRTDRVADFWIYGDLDQGFERARETGKPLLVTYRCVP